MKRPALFRAAAALLCLTLAWTLNVSALTVEDARKLLKDNYVDPVPESVLAQPTIEDMLQALGDPYTEYLDAREYGAFLATMADNTLVGIGVSVYSDQDTADGLLIREVYDGSPAQKGGLLAGDWIVAVDHVSIQGMDVDEAIERIRGEMGSEVFITYQRDGKRGGASLTRAPVSVPATTGQVVDGVGYIACTTWGNETLGHFQSLITDMDSQVQCWLIDLRDNGGGFTHAAADVAGLFCGQGEMFYLRGRDSADRTEDGYLYELYDSQTDALTDKPVFLLVDGMTASSSEAFTATMRDLRGAVVVGDRTYGKGVAQGIWDQAAAPRLFPDGGCMKITVSRFFSALGNTTDVIGVVPDFLVDPAQAQTAALYLAGLCAADPLGWTDDLTELQEGLIDDSGFDDTQESPYARSIAVLSAYDMVHGKGDGLFHPEDTLTRAELAQMLVNALNCWLVENTGVYLDVPADAWYSDAVTAISLQGLMEGTGERRFSPDAVLTCQELFTVLGRLGRWLNDDLDLSVRRSPESAWDLRVLRDYADWAKPSVWLLSCGLENANGRLVNLLWDDPENIDPTAPATRGEAAEVLHSLLYYLTILP